MSKENLDKKQLKQYGNVARIQEHQIEIGQKRADEIDHQLNELSAQNSRQSDELDELLLLAEQFDLNADKIDIDEIDKITQLTVSEKQAVPSIPVLEFDEDWDSYLNNVKDYAFKFNLNLDDDPYEQLMSESQKNEILNRIKEEYKSQKPILDKYDYMFASVSGILCGFIDVFFVGGLSFSQRPEKIIKENLISGTKKEVYHLEQGKISGFTDKKIDSIVKKFAELIYESDKKSGKLVKNFTKKPTNMQGWIGYLEEKFKVPYDARYAKDLGMDYNDLRMSASNHHLKSLAHQPDILGLFFSLLDQFLNTTSVIDKGKIKIIKNPNNKNNSYELLGSDLISKLFCGVVNWLGHLMSDIAGNSNSKTRGQGIPMPFYSLLQMFDLNLLKDKTGEPTSIALIAEMVYTKGVDFRMGVAQAIPVALNEVIIRLFWTIKELCYNKKNFKEVFSINTSAEVRRLLLVGHGSLCTIDAIDAGIRSRGQDPILFFGRLNLVGWSRFGLSAYGEMVARIKGVDYQRLDEDLKSEWHNMYNHL